MLIRLKADGPFHFVKLQKLISGICKLNSTNPSSLNSTTIFAPVRYSQTFMTPVTSPSFFTTNVHPIEAPH